MKYKARLLLIFTALAVQLYAQPKEDSLKTKLSEARSYLYGLNDKQPSAENAIRLYEECAANGSPEAMSALGRIYLYGNGVSKNYPAALQWFNAAIAKGYGEAFAYLGLMYKYGQGVISSFDSANHYFNMSASLHNRKGMYLKGYMHYKGIACKQDYDSAFKLFSESARLKEVGAMYFLGLCYRNGYGVERNVDSAKLWLKRAAKRGYQMAKDELLAKQAENAPASEDLLDKIKAAGSIMNRSYTVNEFSKVSKGLEAKDILGTYEGVLLRYDWSSKYIVQANKLKVTLDFDGERIVGKWIEDDSVSLPLYAYLTKDGLVFHSMQYGKKSHYNPDIPEKLFFQKSTFLLSKDSLNVYLSGNLQLFSASKKEPAKPHFIALQRQVSDAEKKQQIDFRGEDGNVLVYANCKAYPNPFVDVVNIEFELIKPATVKAQLLTGDGKVVFEKVANLQEKGRYMFPLKANTSLPQGIYIVSIQCGKRTYTLKVLKAS